MSLGPQRWHVIAESSFPWEREALEWLRGQLPDRDPWHVWTNLEFIDDEGKVNEVDALALTPAGLFVIEIKSRPGMVSGDAHTWTWAADGRERSVDNPLLLTDRKSKRLASLLRRQPAIVKAKIRLPFLEPLVFLSSTSLNCRLQGQARSGVFLRGRPPVTVNELAETLLPRRPAGDDRPEEAALAHYLGLDDAVPAGQWPALGDAAQAGQVDRGTLATSLVKARERWLKHKAFTELRDQLKALLDTQGQVMTAHELALALLALRGCAIQDDAERLRLASAVVRAALEAESHLDKPRFDTFDHTPAPLVATAPAWADLARQLGNVADTCALVDPLMPPGRVLQALEAVCLPASAGAHSDGPGAATPSIPPARLLRLATMASRGAALSSRQEIYPRGMPALQALRQSMGALLGATELRVHELQDRVRGRYPEAERLPPRPLLDRLLEEAGAPLQWDPQAAKGSGAYHRQTFGGGMTAGTTTWFARHPTVDGGAPPPALAAAADARALETRLHNNLKHGGLLVLTAEPRLAARAQAELLRRFGAASGHTPAVQRFSFDAALLSELRRQADALGVAWATVLRADAADPGSRDWRNLLGLVKRTLPALQQALTNSPAPLLVVNAGLLARYDLMGLASELEASAGRPGRTPAAWLLLPSHQPGVAAIDGVALPLVNAGAVTALPQAWTENVHRAADDDANARHPSDRETPA